MKRIVVALLWISATVLVLLATACSPAAVAAPTTASLTDPFAYCTAVGNIDKPDARYTGPQVPDAVINGFKKAAGLESSTEPMDMLRQTTIWRCMDSKVYACNFGANLPCDSKANADRTPSQALADFCKANSNMEVVPMSVAGHDTIYSWHCVQGTAEVLQQIAQVDKAGYLQNIWYAIQPSP